MRLPAEYSTTQTALLINCRLAISTHSRPMYFLHCITYSLFILELSFVIGWPGTNSWRKFQAWYLARILGGPPTAYGRRKVSNAFQFSMQTLTQLSWMFQEHRKIALAWQGTLLPVSCHCYLSLMLVFERLWYHHNCNWCLNWTGFFRAK